MHTDAAENNTGTYADAVVLFCSVIADNIRLRQVEAAKKRVKVSRQCYFLKCKKNSTVHT